MLVSAPGKFKVNPIKKELNGLTLPASPVLSSYRVAERALPVYVPNVLCLLTIFAIEFCYLQKMHSTKVLRVKYKNSAPIYKVVLGGNLVDNVSICWLQRQAQDWSVILGPAFDERLKQAITSAITCHEELA